MKYNAEEEDVWAEILNDVSTASLNKDKNSLLVLGDEFSGKTSLIYKLRHTKNEAHVVKQGLGLEYSFLNIKDHFSEDIVSRLSVWTLNSESDPTLLLKYALTKNHMSYTDKGWNGMVLIVVDYTKPWSIIERLNHWIKVLDDHIESLKLNGSDKRDLKDKLARSLQEYCTPDAENNKDVLLPLSDGVLTENLGIPIAVVCTKVDGMTALEKDMDYTDAHFDLIQWHVRKFCLKYGAALFYINGKDSGNYNALYRYIVHKLYQFPLDIPPSVIEKDGLMVPAGWDNDQKISILNDTLRSFNVDDELSAALNKPVNRRSDTSREIKAEDDQAFLTRMQSLLQNQRPSNPRPRPTPNQSNRSTIPSQGGAGGAGGPGGPGNDGVLANFFNSLLSKKTSPGPGGTSGTPRTANPSSPRQPPRTNRTVTDTSRSGVP